jgi:hypothetical protein
MVGDVLATHSLRCELSVEYVPSEFVVCGLVTGPGGLFVRYCNKGLNQLHAFYVTLTSAPESGIIAGTLRLNRKMWWAILLI